MIHALASARVASLRPQTCLDKYRAWRDDAWTVPHARSQHPSIIVSSNSALSHIAGTVFRVNINSTSFQKFNRTPVRNFVVNVVVPLARNSQKWARAHREMSYWCLLSWMQKRVCMVEHAAKFDTYRQHAQNVSRRRIRCLLFVSSLEGSTRSLLTFGIFS